MYKRQDKTSEEEEEEENWDTASEEELSWDNLATPPTDYSNVPSPEEEEEGLAAAEASLPTKENDMVSMPEPLLEGPRGVETQASYAQRVDMDKYYLVHGPDIDLTTGHHRRLTTSIWTEVG